VEDLDKTKPLGPGQSGMIAHAVDPDALLPGTFAGAYVLRRELAAGGGGTVYEAQHRLLGRGAAVKVLRRELASSPQMVTRFLREALAVNMIKHPNIVDIYEFGELPDGRPFYVMELLEGTDLRRMLADRGRLPPAEVMEILDPVCSALEAAHSRGVIHRDLKTSNIFAVKQARDDAGNATGPRMIKLLDFGIAKLLHPDATEAGLTMVGARLGTSYTMAPEQIRGEAIDERADIYSLGVVLYHLLTGQYPFRADTMADIEQHHLETPAPRPSHIAPVSPALDAVVLRSMEKLAERRFASARAFRDALREAVEATKSDAPETVAQAAAIYVEVRMGEEADGDDEILDDSSAVLDAAEQRLRDAGLAISLQTGSGLLATRILSDPAEPALLERREVLAIAKALAAELADRPNAHPELHVNVSFHVDRALVRGGVGQPESGEREIVGGEIISVGTWAPGENIVGVYVTPSGLHE
jgi:serine/threonine protein kinase